MAVSYSRWLRDLAEELAERGARIARPKIVSSRGKPIRVLQRALRTRVLGPGHARLEIPHYWAVYVHDGRKAPLRPRLASFFIWWRDPRQDPRLRRFGGVTPKRADQIPRLTPSQFRDALADNREAREAGLEEPVVITPVIRKSTPPVRFFGNRAGGGMVRFGPEARRLIDWRFSELVAEVMPDAFKTITEEIRAVL